MTPGLRKYLDLERLMLDAEAVDEGAADALRDIMDPVWYGLSPDERHALDQRRVGGPFRVLESVRLPVTATLLRPPAKVSHKHYDGKPVSGWRTVA